MQSDARRPQKVPCLLHNKEFILNFVMELPGFSMIFVLIVCLFKLGDAQITGWTKPDDIKSASGTSSNSITVAEDAAVDKEVFTFAATPSNQDTISGYELLTSNVPFKISTQGGILTVSGALDHEKVDKYVIEVKASDSKDPANTGTATATVTVTDVNEATPKFDKTSYTACVEDKATADTDVTTLSATDDDSKQTITYSINSGDSNNDFKFSTAKLQVAKTLDMSTTKKYELVIHAVDNGNPAKTGSTTYTINVDTSCKQNGATALTVTFFTLLLALISPLF